MKTFLIKTVYAVTGLLLPAVLQAQGLYLTSGSQLVSSGTPSLVINNGGLRNEGTFTEAGSTLAFTGNCATSASFISGAGTMTLKNLELRKSANGMQLNRNVSLSGNLTFTSGDSLFLNAYNLDLGTTGVLVGESGSSRITGRTGGYIQRTENLNAPDWVNPGNIGVSIKSAANLGSTVIRRYPIQIAGTSVYRYFNITPTNNATLNAQIRFHYFHEELAGIPESALGVFVSYDNAVTWTDFLYDASDYVNNYIQKGGFTSFSLLTLSDFNYALALKISGFQGFLQNGTAQLQWSSTDEQQAAVYILERSSDQRLYTPVSTIQGRSGMRNSYQVSDILPGEGIYYYRLKIVTPASSFYSNVVSLTYKTGAFMNTGWYPNPATGMVTIRFYASQTTHTELKLTDLNGREVFRKFTDIRAGFNEIQLPLPVLKTGTYILQPSYISKQTGLLLIR